MYAIVATCGKQYKVEEGSTLVLDRLAADVGAEITFDQVLLVGGSDTKVGAPTVDGASVTAKVMSHEKGDKIITYKYKSRKRTRVKKGFRHSHTTVQITGIKA